MQTNIITLELPGHRQAFTITDTPQRIVAYANYRRVALARRLGVSPLSIAVGVSRG